MRLMLRWWIKLLPLTTANFVNLSISPSTFQIAALHILYACVAIFLCVAASGSMTAFLLIAFFIDVLLTEWLSHIHTMWQQRGCLQINENGDIRWQKGEYLQSGQLTKIPLQTSYLIVISVTFPSHQSRRKKERYFVISRDCCHGDDFRTLSLYTRSIINSK